MKVSFFFLIECVEGEFGENCWNNCSGYCINRYKCDKVSGDCSLCLFGFEGLRCNLSRLFYWYWISLIVNFKIIIFLVKYFYILKKCLKGEMI